MPTSEERDRRAEQQRKRRLGHRSCGNCQGEADSMIVWSGQSIPICLQWLSAASVLPSFSASVTSLAGL